MKNHYHIIVASIYQFNGNHENSGPWIQSTPSRGHGNLNETTITVDVSPPQIHQGIWGNLWFKNDKTGGHGTPGVDHRRCGLRGQNWVVPAMTSMSGFRRSIHSQPVTPKMCCQTKRHEKSDIASCWAVNLLGPSCVPSDLCFASKACTEPGHQPTSQTEPTPNHHYHRSLDFSVSCCCQCSPTKNAPVLTSTANSQHQQQL